MANEVEVPISLDTKALLDSLSKIEKNMDELSKSMQKSFQSTTKSVTNSFDKLGNSITGAFTSGVIVGNLATKAIDFLGTTIRNSVTEAINFNRALVEIETILPKNASLTKGLVKQLEDLSAQYGTSPTSQAKAFYEIISAGVENTADATDLLVNANKLATGGLADIEGVIDTLTTVYNVYGREVGNATDASDSLFKTVQLGKTTLSELQNDIGRVLPLAKTFGLSLDEVGSALVLLTNSGLKTRESVSFLNALFVGISRNGKELGSTMNSSAVQTDGFGTVLQRLIARSKGSNDELIRLVGSSEAVRAVQAINTQGLDKYNSTLAEYSNKAGVAAEASKKIIDKDISKQFDIVIQNIGRVSRDFISIFTPAVDSAVKSLNALFVTDTTGDVEAKLTSVRAQIKSLNEQFKIGTIPLYEYTQLTKSLEKQLLDLSNATEGALSPTVGQVRVLQEEAKALQAEIGSLKFGLGGEDVKAQIDGIAISYQNFQSLGPLESTLKTTQLEEKLKGINAQIVALQAKNVVGDANIPAGAVKKTPQEIANEKILLDTQSLNTQLLAEQENYNSQVAILSIENSFARKEAEVVATYDLELAKLEATQTTELAKTEFLKTEEEKRLAQAKINADFALKAQTLANKTSLEIEKNTTAQKKAVAQGYYDTASNLLQAGLVLAKEGSLAQKALLITQATMNTYAGATKAFAEVPAPANFAVSASIVALGLANVAKIAGAKFEQGGIVGGNSYTGDNIPVRVNSAEMILNKSQQAQLFQLANGGGGNSSDVKQMIAELRNTPIVVEISGREIARVVKEQARGGFSFA